LDHHRAFESVSLAIGTVTGDEFAIYSVKMLLAAPMLEHSFPQKAHQARNQPELNAPSKSIEPRNVIQVYRRAAFMSISFLLKNGARRSHRSERINTCRSNIFGRYHFPQGSRARRALAQESTAGRKRTRPAFVPAKCWFGIGVRVWRKKAPGQQQF